MAPMAQAHGKGFPRRVTLAQVAQQDWRASFQAQSPESKTVPSTQQRVSMEVKIRAEYKAVKPGRLEEVLSKDIGQKRDTD